MFLFRFDCHPETKVTATQTECTRRGCTWDETGIPGVPTCYYPPGYGVYKKDTAPQNTSAGANHKKICFKSFRFRVESTSLCKDK